MIKIILFCFNGIWSLVLLIDHEKNCKNVKTKEQRKNKKTVMMHNYYTSLTFFGNLITFGRGGKNLKQGFP